MELKDVLSKCNLSVDDLQNIDSGDLEAIVEAVYGFGKNSDIALDLLYNCIN